ncbi:hypothetical protein [Hymenobacter terricola]|uniref:hypothetical protein n=1 Tax=Hymenobacter terricola TaxID=2819236 RepID=UPI001B306B2F|nr:hypothetical protein [Hymenobacter terricola]
MKKPVSKFGLAALVSQPTSATPTRSVDDLLFAPAGNSIEPDPVAKAPNTPLLTKTRFTNTLPTTIYVQLHRLSFWDRRDMSAIIEVALQEYFAHHPDADKPLPEQERVKRKLPTS